MKEKYENVEITKEAMQNWKANYPDSLILKSNTRIEIFYKK
jgi:transcriptional regulator